MSNREKYKKEFELIDRLEKEKNTEFSEFIKENIILLAYKMIKVNHKTLKESIKMIVDTLCYNKKRSDEKMINCEGLERHEVLHALYTCSQTQGMGVLAELSRKGKPYTLEEAKKDIENCEKFRYYFDYLHGRPLKVDLEDMTEIDPRLYDRDNGGEGAMKFIINKLKKEKGLI